MEENVLNKTPHNLILQNRKDLSVSGVLEVVSFDDETIVIKTTMGELTIQGQNLHISKTNVETGDLVLDGNIEECTYANNDSADNSNRMFKRLFSRD